MIHMLCRLYTLLYIFLKVHHLHTYNFQHRIKSMSTVFLTECYSSGILSQYIFLFFLTENCLEYDLFKFIDVNLCFCQTAKKTMYKEQPVSRHAKLIFSETVGNLSFFFSLRNTNNVYIKRIILKV